MVLGHPLKSFSLIYLNLHVVHFMIQENSFCNSTRIYGLDILINFHNCSFILKLFLLSFVKLLLYSSRSYMYIAQRYTQYIWWISCSTCVNICSALCLQVMPCLLWRTSQNYQHFKQTFNFNYCYMNTFKLLSSMIRKVYSRKK